MIVEHIESGSTGPLYRQIYDYLMKEISSGVRKPGDKLPTEKELCAAFGVSRITSKKTLGMLAEQGIISRSPGRGSFVARSGETEKDASRSHSIGFLTSDFSDAFGTRLLYSIEKTCSALGYHLILKRTHDSEIEEEKAIKALNIEAVAGILLMPAHGAYYNSEILKQILNKRPIVFVDRQMRGLPAPSVSTDNAAAAALGVEYLLRLGHRNIAFFSGSIENTSSVEDRRYGFIRAFANYGISLDSAFFFHNITGSADTDAVKEQLAARPEITAAFTSEYAIALVVKSAAETLGRSVPKDFSIITVDCPEPITGNPVFTYLKQDEAQIGKLAVESLNRIITGTDPASIEDIQIPARLVIGASVTEPRKLA
ncbi:MAG: GntR family transcriptional regulator [Treponema sp.]|jgi:DNA-binding LacI/PurR family transcriptional regulator|nr:GntR family transcriptional regulator [Treponema sp.]